VTGRMLRNFPQAYCYVGIVNCALKPAEGTSRGTFSAKRTRSFGGGAVLSIKSASSHVTFSRAFSIFGGREGRKACPRTLPIL
jgi:hypothetical protein